MIANCFVKQEASLEIISNVTSFCAECYKPIIENETIFYDMNNCCYLCKRCQEALAEKLDSNCETMDTKNNSLL